MNLQDCSLASFPWRLQWTETKNDHLASTYTMVVAKVECLQHKCGRSERSYTVQNIKNWTSVYNSFGIRGMELEDNCTIEELWFYMINASNIQSTLLLSVQAMYSQVFENLQQIHSMEATVQLPNALSRFILLDKLNLMPVRVIWISRTNRKFTVIIYPFCQVMVTLI